MDFYSCLSVFWLVILVKNIFEGSFEARVKVQGSLDSHLARPDLVAHNLR